MKAKRGFTDVELHTLAKIAAEDYKKLKNPPEQERWVAERCAEDLRNIPWGTYAASWATYKESFRVWVGIKNLAEKS